MPWSGTGTFTRLRSWVTDQANGLLVRADLTDSDSNDIAAGISNCIARDGQSTPTAAIPWGGQKLTGLGNGTNPADAVNFGQTFTNPAPVGMAPTGVLNFTGASSFTAPTPAAGDNSQSVATTNFAVGLSFAAALPAQATHADNLVTTDGATASWSSNLKATVIRFKDGADATKLLAFDVAGLTTETTRTISVPDKNGTAALTSDLVLTAAFLSADQTITSAGALTIAHSLGVIPKLVLGYLKCASAENGYSIGNVLCVPLGQDGIGNSNGVSVVVDSTNLNVRFASGGSALFGILDKTTGSFAAATNASWTFHMRAFA